MSLPTTDCNLKRYLLAVIATILLWISKQGSTFAFHFHLPSAHTFYSRFCSNPRQHHPTKLSSSGISIRKELSWRCSLSSSPQLFSKRIRKGSDDDDDDDDSCTCGSGLAYKVCCGPLHENVTLFAAANASQVVRARYTAYAQGLVDFIIQSTHPDNELHDDLDSFRAIFEQIHQHNAQTLEFDACEIIMEEYSRPFLTRNNNVEVALVRSRTHTWHRQRQKETITTEDSAFTRDETSGAWLYRGGEGWSNNRPYGMY